MIIYIYIERENRQSKSTFQRLRVLLARTVASLHHDNSLRWRRPCATVARISNIGGGLGVHQEDHMKILESWNRYSASCQVVEGHKQTLEDPVKEHSDIPFQTNPKLINQIR